MVQIPWQSRRWRGFLAMLLSIPLVGAALVFWRASRAQQEAAIEIAAKSEFPFRIIPVDRLVAPSVEPVSASPGFRDVATYKGMIAVSARAGLFLYDRNGVLTRTLRSGLELPSAELGGLSVGIAAGSAEAELFLERCRRPP